MRSRQKRRKEFFKLCSNAGMALSDPEIYRSLHISPVTQDVKKE